MSKVKKLITLVGIKQAKEGFTFIHHGFSPKCEGCEYSQVCIGNLEVGRVYKVVKLREKVFPCRLHEGGVRVVEVVESEILSSLPSKLAIEGAVINFQSQRCDTPLCEHYDLCVPDGLFNGDYCTILSVKENIPCPKGLQLVKVALKRKVS